VSERSCPVDGTELRRLERSGVQIDACPSCRGVWLDRGELDKIIAHERQDFDDFERELTGGDRERERAQERPRDHGGHAQPHKKKKRHSFLEDLLDFG
jgi:Zn-finger nucleic acid-binding protein